MLAEFLEAKNLEAKIISCSQPVLTVKQACAELNCSAQEIVKSIVFVDAQGNGFLGIVLGNQRISIKKLETILEKKDLVVANEKQVFEITGFEAGGVPPISIFGVPTIIDKKVMEKQIVFAGGGDEQHLLKLSTKELFENAFEARVEEIAE
jgi:prolyl-tRNA editing enzyme YbaK/EbsC (Cys-tRNA(Pro) deacylase)